MYKVVSEATRGGNKKKIRGSEEVAGKKSAVSQTVFPPAGSGFNGVQPSPLLPPPPPPLALQQADHVTAPIRPFLSYWELSCALTGAPGPGT